MVRPYLHLRPGWIADRYLGSRPPKSFASLARESHRLASNQPRNTCRRPFWATQVWEPARTQLAYPSPARGAA